jgi:hypothetical protein
MAQGSYSLNTEYYGASLVQRKERTMASIKMIPEEEATGKVKDIYEEIKSSLGIDFVPKSLRGHGF